MSTYRYARDSRTSAQKAAREWQMKVDMKTACIEMYEAQVASGRMLSDYDQRRYSILRRQVTELMAENPNEAA